MYPTKQRMPNQSGGTTPVSKYFKLSKEEHEIPDDDYTPVGGEGKATPKSSFNKIFSDLTQQAACGQAVGATLRSGGWFPAGPPPGAGRSAGRPPVLRRPALSAWPPNCLRIAERSLSA